MIVSCFSGSPMAESGYALDSRRPHTLWSATAATAPSRGHLVGPIDSPHDCFLFFRVSNGGKAVQHSREFGIVVIQDYRFGHPGTDSIAEPRLRCNVFALLSRSILLSSPVRLQIGSGQGVPATPAATLPTPLRPCLSATPRSGCPALAALPSGHRQRPDPAQHVTEQPPVQMSLGQQQPVVAGMFDQTAAGLH